MPGIEKATGRVVALVVLLVLIAAALRGYLPGGQRTTHEQPTSGPASLIAVVALLSVSIAVFAIAIISSLRQPRPARDTAAGLPVARRDKLGRPKWRILLILLGVLLLWLVVFVLLARLGVPHVSDHTASATASGAPGSSTAGRGAGTPSQPPSAQPEAGRDVFFYLAATTVIMLVLLAVGTVVAARRRQRVAAPAGFGEDFSERPPAASGSESLARAAELGLAEIGDLSREPREAIIACYAAMERGLAKAPGAVPQDSDTPSEVLARAVEHRALHADSASELVDLFAEARFSPHVMTEGHREAAVRVLRLVLAELRSVA